MSAWLVNKKHIDVLVTAAITAKIVEEDQATSLGDLLWQENCKSLDARYGPAEPDEFRPKPGSYRFEALPVEDPFYVLKQIHCYEYQTCEHREYEQSTAHGIAEALTAHICTVVGLGDEEAADHPSYNAATWGVDVDEDDNIFWTTQAWREWLQLRREQSA